MTIRLRTEVRVYCDGATHQGLEFTVGGDRPMTEARAYARRLGWTFTRDGKSLCPQHRGRS